MFVLQFSMQRCYFPMMFQMGYDKPFRSLIDINILLFSVQFVFPNL